MELKQLRDDLKLSQKELADIIGCKQSNISAIEKGRGVTNRQIRSLIEALGLETVSKYADPEELPKYMPNITIGESNTAPIQVGNGNQLSTDARYIKAIEELTATIRTKDEQINRMLSIIEHLQQKEGK